MSDTETTRKFSNRAQIEKFIFDNLVLGCTSSAWELLREGYHDEFHNIFDNPSNSDKRKWVDGTESRYKSNLKEAEWRGPLAVAFLKQSISEIGLVGDIMEAFDNLDLDEPEDIRDAVKLTQGLNQTVNGVSLGAALEFLEEAKSSNVANLSVRYLELWPPKDNE